MARLTVEFTERQACQLEELALAEDLTKAQVIRRALGLMRFCQMERAEGRRLCVFDPATGEVVREIVQA